MGKVKEYLVNKVFWTGMIIGFVLGAMHSWLGL